MPHELIDNEPDQSRASRGRLSLDTDGRRHFCGHSLPRRDHVASQISLRFSDCFGGVAANPLRLLHNVRQLVAQQSSPLASSGCVAVCRKNDVVPNRISRGINRSG
ncbi:hypothetical protein D3C85_1560000 [compost metagenome]